MKVFTEKYKNEKETLPVLSFKYNEDVGENEVLLGEVVICFPLVILLAAERNKRVDEMINELVKHGIEKPVEIICFTSNIVLKQFLRLITFNAKDTIGKILSSSTLPHAFFL